MNNNIRVRLAWKMSYRLFGGALCIMLMVTLHSCATYLQVHQFAYLSAFRAAKKGTNIETRFLAIDLSSVAPSPRKLLSTKAI